MRKINTIKIAFVFAYGCLVPARRRSHQGKLPVRRVNKERICNNIAGCGIIIPDRRLRTAGKECAAFRIENIRIRVISYYIIPSHDSIRHHHGAMSNNSRRSTVRSIACNCTILNTSTAGKNTWRSVFIIITSFISSPIKSAPRHESIPHRSACHLDCRAHAVFFLRMRSLDYDIGNNTTINERSIALLVDAEPKKDILMILNRVKQRIGDHTVNHLAVVAVDASACTTTQQYPGVRLAHPAV